MSKASMILNESSTTPITIDIDYYKLKEKINGTYGILNKAFNKVIEAGFDSEENAQKKIDLLVRNFPQVTRSNLSIIKIDTSVMKFAG
jgi:hypothetical protein